MNKNLKAHQLSVKSFRGINQEISLQLGNITIIKGENGTGKSSFINAIEYLFSEELEFLKNKTINKNAAFNRLSDKNDAKIELKFKSKRFIKFENGKRENSSMFDDILKNNYVKNASFILNRKKLLKFIDGTQGNRYTAVMDLCGMDKIDKVQSAISSSKSNFKKDLDNFSNIYDAKLSELSELLTGKSEATFDKCVNELNIRLKDNGKDIINEDTDIEKFINTLDLSNLTILKSKINDFNLLYDQIDFNKLESNLKLILEEYENIASDNLKSSQSLLKTLISSYDYIELTSSEECPVCKNSIDPSEILPQISSEIEDIDKNNSSFNNWKRSVIDLIKNVDDEIESCKKLNLTIDDINKLAGDILPNFEYDELTDLKNDLNDFSQFNKVVSDFKDINLSPLYNEITAIKKSMTDYEINQNIDDLSEIYNMLFIIKDLKELKLQISELSKQYSAVSKTFDIFTESKEEFINDIISDIRNDIKTYYEYIHEDDLIKAPDIQLSGSKLIDVYLDSFGDKVDSRSYASEGHLDTLGICIFLAFNKKFNELPIIVLDDVLTTVDLPHKERIGRLIVDELVDYQFIITTHSSLWLEQFKRLCIDSKRNFVVHELIDWTLDEGPITAKPLDAEDKIEKYLSDNHQDFQAAGNTARRYLEFTLTQICIANNIKVPINDKYDVGTLFDEAKNHTLRVVQGTSIEPYYLHIWSEINKTRYIANILSHFNEESDQIPKSDVQKFCRDVVELNHAFTCDCGKSFLKLDPVSHKLICSNPKCRDAIDMNSFSETEFDFEKGETKL